MKYNEKRFEGENLQDGICSNEEFLLQLKKLMQMSYQNSENIRKYVKEVVKTYHPVEH